MDHRAPIATERYEVPIAAGDFVLWLSDYVHHKATRYRLPLQSSAPTPSELYLVDKQDPGQWARAVGSLPPDLFHDVAAIACKLLRLGAGRTLLVLDCFYDSCLADYGALVAEIKAAWPKQGRAPKKKPPGRERDKTLLPRNALLRSRASNDRQEGETKTELYKRLGAAPDIALSWRTVRDIIEERGAYKA